MSMLSSVNDVYAPCREGEREVIIHGLADALRHVGKQVKAAAENELAQFYPPDPDGSRPIAYLWARTVRCEGIGCGAEIPLVRSFWLSKKAGQKRALGFRVERPKGKPPLLAFEILAPKADKDVPQSTVANGKATCPCCNTVLPPVRLQSQLTSQRGGTEVQSDSKGQRCGGATLLIVVTGRKDVEGRQYRLSTRRDYDAVRAAGSAAEKLGASAVPDEPINPIRPSPNARGLSAVTRYGITTFGALFTVRQNVNLAVTAKVINGLPRRSEAERAVVDLAALALSRYTDISNSLCRWESTKTQVRNLFTRHAIAMLWDFAEADVFGDNAGNYLVTLETMARVVERLQFLDGKGQVQQADAQQSPMPDASVSVWFTDPPYYDAIPYADLSDFFFVWLRRVLPSHPLLNAKRDPETGLTPKLEECVWNQSYKVNGVPKDGRFFETAIAGAFSEGRRVLRAEGIACVVFAHKTTEGWEALLSGMLKAGFVITASWPITTELANRSLARDAAALAGSVHLVCRPRPDDAGVGDWSEVKAAMEKRIREWLPTLVKHGVRGADAIFSCLGPALESYSKFEKVLTAGDREVPLGGDPDAIEPEQRGFLAYVFETLSKEALRQILGDPSSPQGYDAASAGEGFEEDARLSALFLWTLQTTKAEG